MSDVEPLDLGHGHLLRYVAWSPDRTLNPQYAHLPDVAKYGAIDEHDQHGVTPAVRCRGFVLFDGEVAAQVNTGGSPTWTVESWEPLTLSPSLLCGCGDHGFIRDGRWVPV